MKHIMFCETCKKFTMKEACCNLKTIEPKPMKYTPADKYASYKREAKRELLKEKGLL